MTEYGLHGVAVYNPDLLSPEELKRYFVARIPLLERIMGNLRREKPGHIPQHRLFLGQRGMGKTTLLRRIALAVNEDPDLSARWLPLTFPEEQYNISVPGDLWLNCLDALGDALEQAGRKDEADALDDKIATLPRGDAPKVLHVLIDQVAHLDRRLLLLLDNVDLILDRLRDEHWALRETLQSEPTLLVYGASARAIEASYKYDAAFYDFFRIDELKGLTEDELRTTLIRLAEVGNTPAVVETVHTDPARIRTLHTLTGGNPRTAVLLYGVLAQGLGGDVRSDLEGLLDRVTPLYKARFEELPEQGQKLVDAVALRWDPVTARALADDLGWDINLTSAQLNRLHSQGLVEKTKPFKGKRTLFQISERFFNIWYLMRASRRVRRKLTWLVRFLRMFFSAEALRDHAKGQLERPRSTMQDTEYAFALAQCVDEIPLRSALETHALRSLVDDRSTRESIGRIFDLKGEDAAIAGKAERLRALADIRERMAQALEDAGVDFDRQAFLLRYLATPSATLAEKRHMTAEAGKWSKSRWRELEEALAQQYRDWEVWFGQAVTSIYRGLAEGDMETPGDIEGARAAEERHAVPNLVAASWVFRTPSTKKEARAAVIAMQNSSLNTASVFTWMGNILYGRLGRFDDAEQAYRRAIVLNPNNTWTWHNLGNLLHHRLNRLDEAVQAYRQAIEIDPTAACSWYSLGALLHQHLRRFDEAEQAYLHAIKIDPDESAPWNGLGALLLDHLHRTDEAEQVFRRAIEIDPKDAGYRYNLGNLLHYHLHRYKDAEKGYRQAIELDSNYVHPWNDLGNLLQDHLKRYDEAEQAYRRAIEIDPNYAHPWNNLGTLFQHKIKRYTEAEQAYRQAIALNPEVSGYWSNLGDLLKTNLHRHDEAEQAYYHAIEIDPTNANALSGLGGLLHLLQRFEEAEKAFRRTIEINPEFAEGYNGLAWFLYQTVNNLPEARRLAEKAVKLDPENLYYSHTLATILIKLGEWRQAEPHIRAFIEKGGDNFHEIIWKDILLLFREAVANKQAADALRILETTEAGERWRPLREALAAAAEGTPDYLRQVAPEVRKTALEIYRKLAEKDV